MSDMVVVIGGSGFVGTRLCQVLRDSGRPFTIVDKRLSDTFPENCVIADVRDEQRLMEALPAQGVWINLAAEHRDDVRPRSLYDDVNVKGARNICRVAAAKGVNRIIFTSSVACYGNAPVGTGEDGAIAPFNEYGRTKALAEAEFRTWQCAEPERRSLVIVRPTVIFGEQNRGNVYNLLRQIATGRFVMVGAGTNRKSMAYVGNVAAFLAFLLPHRAGSVLVNYVDEPSLCMNELIGVARGELGLDPKIRFRLPFWLGIALGRVADAGAWLTGRQLAISAIRVRKFASDSHFTSASGALGFEPPYTLEAGLRRTISHEFGGGVKTGPLFFSE